MIDARVTRMSMLALAGWGLAAGPAIAARFLAEPPVSTARVVPATTTTAAPPSAGAAAGTDRPLGLALGIGGLAFVGLALRRRGNLQEVVS